MMCLYTGIALNADSEPLTMDERVQAVGQVIYSNILHHTAVFFSLIFLLFYSAAACF
jgi:hypothetical protein